MSDIIEKLQQIVGPAQVLSAKQVAQRATHFWNPSPMVARALVKPATVDQISDVLRTCFEHGQSVVTHGGVTGLADGEKSTSDDIVLSLERLNQIESVDAVNRTMTVQAGCVLQSIHEAANDCNLLYGVDLGARGSCTIGGNISTNAGGLSVLRYGMTRDQILGLEVVLADGTVITALNSLIKNNTGYDLKQLFIGSEGTLGVVTRAVLKLRPATPTRNTAIVAFNTFEQVTETLALVSRELNANLNAFEIIWNDFYRLSTNPDITGTSRAPLTRDYSAYAIIESRGASVESDKQQFQQTLEELLEKDLIADAVIAQSETEQKDIWQIRENVDLSLRHSPLFVYDISLPVNHMEAYVDEIRTNTKKHWPDAVVHAYGHLADCNLHISIAPKPENFIRDTQQQPIRIQAFNEEESKWYETVNRIVFEPLASIGGSISAEHGIGLLKKKYLHYCVSDEEIAAMRLLKKSLDPKGILNPGKILDME